MKRKYYLCPQTSEQKDFYGKAVIVETENMRYLYSYKTLIAGLNELGDVFRYWDGKSRTTSKHIKHFLIAFDVHKRTPSDFYEYPLSDKTESGILFYDRSL